MMGLELAKAPSSSMLLFDGRCGLASVGHFLPLKPKIFDFEVWSQNSDPHDLASGVVHRCMWVLTSVQGPIILLCLFLHHFLAFKRSLIAKRCAKRGSSWLLARSSSVGFRMSNLHMKWVHPKSGAFEGNPFMCRLILLCRNIDDCPKYVANNHFATYLGQSGGKWVLPQAQTPRWVLGACTWHPACGLELR